MVKPDTQALADRLVLAAIYLTRTLRTLTRGGALSGAEAGALAVVVYGGRMVARDVAVHQDVTPATISRLVTVLEARELVTRTPDEADARLQWIEATPEGADLLAHEHGRRLAPLAKVLADLSADEREKVVEAVETLRRLTARLE